MFQLQLNFLFKKKKRKETHFLKEIHTFMNFIQKWH